MRVTNKQLLNIVTRSVATSSEQLMKAQERVASMKIINRPSDDPVGIKKVLEYRKKISSIDQYLRNITPAKTRVETTSTQLEEVHGLLADAKEIAISQSSGDDASGRVSAAQRVGDIYDRIRDMANTRLGGSYIFGGHNTDTLPFPDNEVTLNAESTLNGGEYFNISSSSTDYYVWYDIDNGSSDPTVSGRTGIEVDIASGDTAAQVATKTANVLAAMGDFSGTTVSDDAVTIKTADGEGVDAAEHNTGFGFFNDTYNGDDGSINTILGEGVSVKINVDGNEAFTGSGVTDGVDILTVLQSLKEALEAEPYNPVPIENQIDRIAQGMSQVESVMSRQATTFSRLEQTETQWTNLKQIFQTTLSDTEDADMAEVVVELSSQENAYEMALSSAAKMLQKNLLDFLG